MRPSRHAAAAAAAGKCKVEESEKGWWITLIMKDPMQVGARGEPSRQRLGALRTAWHRLALSLCWPASWAAQAHCAGAPHALNAAACLPRDAACSRGSRLRTPPAAQEIEDEKKLKRTVAEKEEEDRHLAEVNAQVRSCSPRPPSLPPHTLTSLWLSMLKRVCVRCGAGVPPCPVLFGAFAAALQRP